MTDYGEAYRKAFDGKETGVCECCHLELIVAEVEWVDDKHRGTALLCALCAVSELARSVIFKEVTLEELARAIQRNTNLLLASDTVTLLDHSDAEENDEDQSG